MLNLRILAAAACVALVGALPSPASAFVVDTDIGSGIWENLPRSEAPPQFEGRSVDSPCLAVDQACEGHSRRTNTRTYRR